MADKLIANIHTAFDVYTHNTRPFLSKVVNHAKGIEPLDQDTLESLLEQASTRTIIFQQDFEVNYYTLLKVDPSEHDISLNALASSYELLLGYVGIVFAFALESNIDIDDYPVLRTLLPLMKGPNEKLSYALNSLEHFLARTQPIVNTFPPVDNNNPPTIKAEVDNSPTILQNPSTPVAPQDPPAIKVEPNNSPIHIQDPIFSNTPFNLQSPNTTINIKAEIDIDSQPMETETLYDPDMDNSETSYDYDTDSTYDSSDSDYSDFEDLEGDFLESRERAYSNIWKHIPPVRHIDPFG